MATICQSRVAPVAGWVGAACFPTDAVALRPVRGPAPDGCVQWQQCDSIAQTALESANAEFPTTALVCQNDSHVLAQNDEHIPSQSAQDRSLGLLSRQTN